MSETSTAAATEQQEAVKANWDALKGALDVVYDNPPTEQAQTQEKETVQNQDVVESEKVTEEKPETTAEETTKEKETEADKAESGDDKEGSEAAPIEEDAPILEFKPEDIKDAPLTFDEGDWRGVGADIGLNITENSFDAFQAAVKEQYVSKADYQKALELSEKEILSQFPPDIAAAIELAKMGVPKELIFEPTKQIDGYLALEDAALVREDLKAQGYSDEDADSKMEKLIEEGKVERDAKLLRFELGKQKEQIVQNIQQTVSKKAAEIEQVQRQSKEREITQLKEALNNTSEFMGVNLTKEAKETLIKKIQSGAYEKELSSAQLKVNAILHKEFGQKFTEYAKNKFRSEGKMAEVKKLANVPPVKAPSAGVEKVNTQTNGNWDALKGIVP